MSMNSFKRGPAPPSIRIRTPSPPRDAVEPISPTGLYSLLPSHQLSTSHDGVSNGYHNSVDRALSQRQAYNGGDKQKKAHTRNRSQQHQPHRRTTSHSQVPASPIDALASAASSLAASPTFGELLPQSPQYRPQSRFQQVEPPRKPSSKKRQAADDTERPSKRARSEMLHSPIQQQQASRPATSYTTAQIAHNVEHMVNKGARTYQEARRRSEVEEHERRQEAELLLFFKQTASFPTGSSRSNSHANVFGDNHTSVFAFSKAGNGREVSAQSSNGAVQTHTPPEDVYVSPEVSSDNAVVQKTPEIEEMIEEPTQPPSEEPLEPLSLVENDVKPKEDDDQEMEDAIPDQLQSPKSLGHDDPNPPIQKPVISSDQKTLSKTTGKIKTHKRRKSEANARGRQFLAPPEQNSRGSRGLSVPPDNSMLIRDALPGNETSKAPMEPEPVTVCPSCNFSSSLSGEMKNWIECSGCKQWFHFACAGFKNDREVGRVDKFFCRACKPKLGPTTYLRKSARAHAAVDYAGLNQGVIRTPDDTHEHHYIHHIKDGNFNFDPETFPRMRPEIITLDYFEKSGCFTQPIVIPASFNPRPRYPGSSRSPQEDSSASDQNLETDQLEDFEHENVPDDGQDKLDMVIPQGLTVRRVSEMYGPEEPVEVIEVKSQEGSDRKWNMKRWADYYEDDGEKIIRNVISLEVSTSKLGRLIRRPKVVRDLDLQDAVWPQEETDKGFFPKVQFYCLMSVADCYTDFHIDFGGSSVYYHIIKGSKTFFFIPPKTKHLKKYEEWCLSPAQNWTFLGDQTKECYRVDLSEGDTMLIPSGWIHAVWTPENSLVIGGNFLTRMHFDMQIKVAEIEKATKVARKFRYPYFQKVLWYAILKYLEEDPLPQAVAQLFYDRKRVLRETPIYLQTNNFGHNSFPGPENYHARYYSKQEIESLPALVRFVHRTVMISLGKVENITVEVRNAVARSIPKGRGDPLEIIKTFAAWTAWKRGNEELPEWAHPDAILPEGGDPKVEKKFFAATRKQPDRKLLGNETPRPAGFLTESQQIGLPAPQLNGYTNPVTPISVNNKHLSTPKTSQLGPKRIACDACRKRRIRCKHKDDVVTGAGSSPGSRVLDSVLITQGASPPPGTLNRDYSPESDSQYLESLELRSSGSSLMRSAQEALGLSGGDSLLGLQSESADSKKGRNKACVDCRRSKRRCIHDESGAIDPVKAQEAKIPRGTTSHKKRRYMEIVERSQRERQEAISRYGGSAHESSPDDTKMTNGADGAYSVHTPNRTAYGHPVSDSSNYDQNHHNDMSNDFERNYEDFVVSSIEEQNGHRNAEHAPHIGIEESAIDPSLTAAEPRTPAPKAHHAAISSPLSDFDASVSPHQHMNGVNSANSLRQSSRQPKPIERFSIEEAVHRPQPLHTPRPGSIGTAGSPPNSYGSGSKQRKSSSSSLQRKNVKLLQHSPVQQQQAPEPEPIKTEAELENERSLQLARELQEMDFGLRRRRGSKPAL